MIKHRALWWADKMVGRLSSDGTYTVGADQAKHGTMRQTTAEPAPSNRLAGSCQTWAACSQPLAMSRRTSNGVSSGPKMLAVHRNLHARRASQQPHS